MSYPYRHVFPLCGGETFRFGRFCRFCLCDHPSHPLELARKLMNRNESISYFIYLPKKLCLVIQYIRSRLGCQICVRKDMEGMVVRIPDDGY